MSIKRLVMNFKVFIIIYLFLFNNNYFIKKLNKFLNYFIIKTELFLNLN